jgi:hypothetical protein
MEKPTINTPFDITTLLENHLKEEDDRPQNFLASLYQIEKAFTVYLTELETHEEFLNKYLDHWRQLSSLKAVLENLTENSKDNGLDWRNHQRPYVNFIKRVWAPFPKFFATQNRSSKL